jgi:hypothetical protein
MPRRPLDRAYYDALTRHARDPESQASTDSRSAEPRVGHSSRRRRPAQLTASSTRDAGTSGPSVASLESDKMRSLANAS